MSALLKLSLLGLCCLAARAQWPPQDDDLLFLFQDSFEEIFALDAGSGEALLNYSFQPSGLARFNSLGQMELAHGRFHAPGQDHLRRQLGGDFALECWLFPAHASDGQILNLGSGLTLLQRDQALVCRLSGASSHELTCALPPQTGSAIALSLSGHQLRLYRNGDLVAETDLGADRPNWQSFAIDFGSGSFDQLGWSGRLADLALYGGAFDPARAAAHHKALDEILHPPPKPLVVKARVLACSTIATPASIEPYPASLSVFEYEVLEVKEGLIWDAKIRVAHYVVLDHRALAVAAAVPGDVHLLVLEPFAANRQVALTHRSETLPAASQLKLYLATQILEP